MKITQSNDPFFQKLPPLTVQQRIELLERRKSSLLHEMKIVSERMNRFIKTGLVSDADNTEGDENEKYRGCQRIPGSETRRLLTKDPIMQQKVLQAFARFSNLKEIFGSSVLFELERLQNKDSKTPGVTKA